MANSAMSNYNRRGVVWVKTATPVDNFDHLAPLVGRL